MDLVLTESEVRVLGCLVEKEITTPDYYPLSLNALMTACNQKTNREPVVSYTESDVREVVDTLLEKGLAIRATGDRVFKYDNYFADTYHLSPQQVAVMCVLMLRGAQTPGEIKGRTERLHDFSELVEVELVLAELAERDEGALVARLPRQPGRKEHRYAHLLSGESAGLLSAGEEGEGRIDGIGQLQEEVAGLRAEVQELREQFADFRRQFE